MKSNKPILGDVEKLKFKTPTTEQIEEIMAEVRWWWARSPSSERFQNASAPVSVALAEYIANKRGFTLYKQTTQVETG